MCPTNEPTDPLAALVRREVDAALDEWASDTSRERSQVSYVADRLTTALHAYEAERDVGYVLSCPWCGMNTRDWIHRRVLAHLIDCGDKRFALLTTAQAECERLRGHLDVLRDECAALRDENSALMNRNAILRSELANRAEQPTTDARAIAAQCAAQMAARYRSPLDCYDQYFAAVLASLTTPTSEATTEEPT